MTLGNRLSFSLEGHGGALLSLPSEDREEEGKQRPLFLSLSAMIVVAGVDVEFLPNTLTHMCLHTHTHTSMPNHRHTELWEGGCEPQRGLCFGH